MAQASDVKTTHDDHGWKLQVDGQDFAVRGVVWSYTPAGENFTYDLWRQPDEFIARVIDTDMAMMKKLGVNAIRVFSTVPPRWVEYIFDRWGIYTMVNDLFGRYGVEVEGKWQFPTNYDDPATRKVLLAQARKTFDTYKDTRGVLLYMLGNESNYGLDWSSNAIENLPGGERNSYKARALYTLFEQALALGKTIDQHHPMGLINGDLQYLKEIAELVPDLDIIGVNTYRGPKSFDGFYNSISKVLKRPFVYTELGADAFNAATKQEDQFNQSAIIESQWQEIYSQSYGKGKAADCLGGFVFEWMDEWWKTDLTTGLADHSPKATWNNGAYAYDEVSGQNNMNEAWFGIVAQSRKTDGGVPRRVPRMAYFALQDVWKLDAYQATQAQIDAAFAAIDHGKTLALGQSLSIGDGTGDPRPPLELHGSVTTRAYFKGDDKGWAGQLPTAADDPSITSDPLQAFQTTAKLGATIRMSENLTGNFVMRFLTSPTANNPAVDLSDPVESAAMLEGGSNPRTPVHPYELYQASVNYASDELDVNLHYHDGHPDWVGEGDLFGLLPEAWDLLNTDKAGSKAPFGIELHSSEYLPGLKVYVGPELYWGANPSVLAKYVQSFGPVTLALMHDEEFGTYMNTTSNEVYTIDQATADRWTSLSGSYKYPGLGSVDAGILFGRYNRVNSDKYTYNKYESGTLTTGAQFSLADTMAGKIRVATDGLPYVNASVQYIYAGLLAGTRSAVARGGSQLYDSGSGNRSEIKGSVTGIYGDFELTATGLYRTPLVDPLDPATSGESPRDPTQDSFTVWDNRKATQAELVFTWNPTGATYFHDWDNADREAAPVAASLGFLYNFYLGPTDYGSFTDTTNAGANGIANNLYVFTGVLPEVSGTWSLLARVTGRPLPGVKMNITGQIARQQATGYNPDWNDPVPVTQFWKTGLQVAVGRLLVEGSYARDAWGPYDWDRQFGISYPQQWMFGVAYGLKPISFLTDTDRVGVRVSERGFGSNTPASESSGLTYRYVTELYAGWSF